MTMLKGKKKKILQEAVVRNRKVLMKDVGLSWKSKEEFG